MGLGKRMRRETKLIREQFSEIVKISKKQLTDTCPSVSKFSREGNSFQPNMTFS